MTRWTRLGRWSPFAFATGAVVGLAIFTTMFRHGDSNRASPATAVQHAPPGQGPSTLRAERTKSVKMSAVPRPPTAEPTWADVMGNPECIMKPGAGSGSDVAVILVPGEDGSRFAVIDGSGLVFGDTLPFWSTHYPSFARRPDGSILAGFGGAAMWGSAVEGAAIYQDGQLVYESAEATRFGVAKDGSSFFVVEPMAGGVSRLAIRNLDLGIEVHHELDAVNAMPEARFTVGGNEVVVGPQGTIWGAIGQFSFFPTDGGEPRQLRLVVRSPGHQVFASSNEGYFTTYDQLGVTSTTRQFRYDQGKVSADDLWARNLRISGISDDGAWLVAEDGAHVHVLNASTGETVFKRPRTEDDDLVDLHDGRLVVRSPVASPDALERCRARREHVASRAVVDETDGTSQERHLVDVTEEKACLADLRERGLYREVQDVYDLRTLADGAGPDHYRVEYGEDPHCGSGDDPFGTLEVRNDQLVYVPRSLGDAGR